MDRHGEVTPQAMAALAARRFHGAKDNSRAIMQEPLTPAKTSPAPTNAASA